MLGTVVNSQIINYEHASRLLWKVVALKTQESTLLGQGQDCISTGDYEQAQTIGLGSEQGLNRPQPGTCKIKGGHRAILKKLETSQDLNKQSRDQEQAAVEITKGQEQLARHLNALPEPSDRIEENDVRLASETAPITKKEGRSPRSGKAYKSRRNHPHERRYRQTDASTKKPRRVGKVVEITRRKV